MHFKYFLQHDMWLWFKISATVEIEICIYPHGWLKPDMCSVCCGVKQENPWETSVTVITIS